MIPCDAARVSIDEADAARLIDEIFKVLENQIVRPLSHEQQILRATDSQLPLRVSHAALGVGQGRAAHAANS
jgi:hypothetical protein